MNSQQSFLHHVFHVDRTIDEVSKNVKLVRLVAHS